MANSDFGKAFDNLANQIGDEMHEAVAQQLADIARENGLTSADNIQLNVEGNDGTIDEARVRRRANEILAGG